MKNAGETARYQDSLLHLMAPSNPAHARTDGQNITSSADGRGNKKINAKQPQR